MYNAGVAEFDWDVHNVAHIARHGIVPAQAEEAVVSDPVEVGQSWRGGERRVVIVGLARDGIMLTVVWTPRQGRIRVVTARRSSREEGNFYAEEKVNAT